MTTRNRVIYQSKAVFAGPSPASGAHYHPSGVESGNYLNELTRVQSINHSFDITRTDINQHGQLAAIAREIIEAPTVSVDLNYYLTDGSNEHFLGFNIGGAISSISGFLDKTQDERNIFVLTVPEGRDAVGNVNQNAHETVAIGNAFISDYSVEAAVGDIPSASVTFEALNIRYEQGSSGLNIPAINPETGEEIQGVSYIIPEAVGSYNQQISALRPGDISLELDSPLGAVISGNGSAHIQSMSLSVPLSREPLDRLGSRFSFSREITFPINVSLSVSANVADIRSGGLADMICSDDSYDLKIAMNEPACGGQSATRAMYFVLKNAKVDSQNFSSSIGSNETVDITWSAQVGGPEDNDNGLFISGKWFNSL